MDVKPSAEEEFCRHRYETCKVTELTYTRRCRKCGREHLRFRNLYPGYQ